MSSVCVYARRNDGSMKRMLLHLLAASCSTCSGHAAASHTYYFFWQVPSGAIRAKAQVSTRQTGLLHTCEPREATATYDMQGDAVVALETRAFLSHLVFGALAAGVALRRPDLVEIRSCWLAVKRRQCRREPIHWRFQATVPIRHTITCRFAYNDELSITVRNPQARGAIPRSCCVLRAALKSAVRSATSAIVGKS